MSTPRLLALLCLVAVPAVARAGSLLPLTDLTTTLNFATGSGGYYYDKAAGFVWAVDVKMSLLDTALDGRERSFRFGDCLGATAALAPMGIRTIADPSKGFLSIGLIAGLQASYAINADVEVGLRAYLDGRMLLLEKAGGWSTTGALMGRWRSLFAEAAIGPGAVAVNVRYVREQFFAGLKVDAYQYRTGGTNVEGVLFSGLLLGYSL